MTTKNKLFLWNLMPDWVKNDEPGHCPTMYGTGTYEGDKAVRERVKKLLEIDKKPKKAPTKGCPECGKPSKEHPTKHCDMVLGRRGWRQLGIYDG